MSLSRWPGARVLPALVLCLAVLLLHHEVLLQGRIYHMDDAADGYYPSHVAIARAYAAGELPTWERGSWGGFPLLADPYYGAFYPLSATFPLIGMARGLGWNIALHMLLGAAGTYLLLRRRRLGVGPALLGAAALGFSTFMVERIRHIIFPQLVAWLPWVLWAAEGVLRGGARRRDLPLLALFLGLALICGALPLLPFAALFLAAYLLPRLLKSRGPGRLPGLAAAGTVGLLLAMAQIAPTLAHLPLSPRQLGTDYAFASSYAWPKLAYLATLVAPDVLGGTDRGAWRGAYNHWEMAGWYGGLWTALLAPLALWRRGRPELFGLLVCALLGIGLAFGDAGRLHPWFYHHVPVYAALRCPVRALVLYVLAAPILAAEGLAGVLAAAERRPRRGGPAIVAAAACLAACAGAALYFHQPALVLPRAANPAALKGALVHLLIVLGAGGAVVALLWGRVVPPACGGLALALITLADVLVIGRGSIRPLPPDAPAGSERFAAVDWLLAQQPADRFVPDPQGPFRLHNLGMVYGIESAGGYDSFSIWRYVHFLYILNNGHPYPYPHLHHDPAAGDIQRFDSPLVDLLNVRWVIGPSLPAPGAPRWVERYGLPPGERIHARYEPLWDPQLHVYENTQVLPRAFVVYGARVLGDEEATRALSALDPRREVLLDQAPAPPPAGDGRDSLPAKIIEAGRHRLVIEAETPVPGVLVVSEAHYPGWSATLDGRPVPLLRADYALRGVALPAGKHVVEMRFRSRPTELGMLLSALGGLGVLGLFLFSRRRRR